MEVEVVDVVVEMEVVLVVILYRRAGVVDVVVDVEVEVVVVVESTQRAVSISQEPEQQLPRLSPPA